MANGQQTSIRENSVPIGGMVNITPTSTTSDIRLADTLVLKQQANILMERTLINYSEYSSQELKPGQQTNIKHLNVGLGTGTWLTVKGHVQFNNSTPTTVDFHEEFPFNLIKMFETEFNGNNKLHHLTGYQILQNMVKRKPHLLKEVWGDGYKGAETLRSSTHIASGVVTGNGSLRYPEVIAGGSDIERGQYLMMGALGLTGVTSATNFDFEFNVYIPFTLREDIPLGMVPLQNNSIHAQMIIQTNNIMTAEGGQPGYFSTPLSTPGSVDIIDYNNSYFEVRPCLEYMNIPAPMMTEDNQIIEPEALYGYFANTSYLLTNIDYVTASTGRNAFRFSLPNNYLLMSLHATAHQFGRLIDPYYATNNWELLINNSLSANKVIIERKRFMDEYFGRQSLKGVLRMDLTEGVDMASNNLNTTRWINLYDVNNPVLQADINSLDEWPTIDWNILSESLVPQNVMLI